MNIINGEGYAILKWYSNEARTTLLGTLNLPYTEKGGYTERWSEENFSHINMSLDFDNPSLSENQFVIGFWGEWELSWASLSIPKEIWLSLQGILNGRRESNGGRSKYYLTLTPRSDYNETFREYPVNYTGKGLETTGNTGGSAASGSKGLKLSFKTVETQAMSFANPDAVTYTVISDDMLLEFQQSI